MTTTDTTAVTVATTTIAERFAKVEAWTARREASILYRIVVDTMTNDIEAIIDTPRMSALLMVASRLSGIRYEDLWHAAQECAAAERRLAQRVWENRRGIAQHPPEAFSIPTPKHDAVHAALRF